MKTNIIMLAAVAAMFASSSVLAEPKEWKDADANGDGNVDMTEYQASGVEDMSYKEIDANGDGKISRDEYEEALSGCE